MIDPGLWHACGTTAGLAPAVRAASPVSSFGLCTLVAMVTRQWLNPDLLIFRSWDNSSPDTVNVRDLY